MTDLEVLGHIGGKEPCRTTRENTLAITSLSYLLNLVDILLTITLSPCLDDLVHVLDSCWLGGLKYTRVLDATHGLSVLSEKSPDLESAGAVPQADIQQYYD